MKERNKSYTRRMRQKHIRRKLFILSKVYRDTNCFGAETPGKLSKNKVHCSCFMCRNHGHTRGDLRSLEKMDYDMNELYSAG